MAKGNRKAFEDYVIGFMKKVTKSGHNAVIYRRLFDRLNDKEMEEFVQQLEAGMSLSIWAGNHGKDMVVFENIKKLALEIGLELEQQLIIVDEDTGIRSLTHYKAIVGTAEVRKQRQMLVKKFSAAKDDHSIDDLTGQVMGDSRASGMSQAEVTVLRNLGLNTLANELYNVKAGDAEALKVYKNDLITSGKTTTNGSLKRGTGVKVLRTANRLLRGRHIDNNLDER